MSENVNMPMFSLIGFHAIQEGAHKDIRLNNSTIR